MDRPSAAQIELARAYGIEVLPIVDYGFTDLSGTSNWLAPPLPQNRAIWAKRMVDTWRDMKNPPTVFEVWNEPWVSGFWPPEPDPAAYLELVKAFAKEAWAVWPHATLLISADEGQTPTSQFRKKLLAADTGGLLADPRILPTTHNYVEARTPLEVTPQPCSWDLNRFQCAYNDFKAHGHPDPQVWITEFGWESDNPAPGYAEYGAVTEQEQADRTVEALKIFRSSGKVAAAYSFLYSANDGWNFNWLRPDGREKPVAKEVRDYLATS